MSGSAWTGLDDPEGVYSIDDPTGVEVIITISFPRPDHE
jgi:hypothetical protein